MSTVSNKQVAPKVVTPKPFPPRFDYGRPTNGGQPVAGKSEGNPAGGDAPAGIIPPNPLSGTVKNVNPDGSLTMAYLGDPGTMAGNAFPNPDISGAAIVAPVAQPDATGHPAISAGSKGTVGDSGAGLGQ